MILVEKTLNILNALSGVNTVLYDSPAMSNFKLDRKEGPFALMYPVVDINDSFTKQNTYRESISIEIFFCDVVKFDSDGEQHLAVVDDMYAVAKAFVHQLQLDREIMIDGDVKMTTGYGRYDKYVTGVSVECKLVLKQPVCLEGDEPEVRELVITEDGEYDVASIGKVIVKVMPEPEPPTPVIDRNYLCFTNVEQVENTITIAHQGGYPIPYTTTCEYITNGTDWVSVDLSNGQSYTITLQPNQSVWFRGTGDWALTNGSDQDYFQSTGLIDVTGNPLSLTNKADFDTITSVPNYTKPIRCFARYLDTNTRSFLKVRNADFTFDNIESVPKTNNSTTNQCPLYGMLGLGSGTNQSQNTYLQRIKLGFKRGVTIDMSNNYRQAPIGPACMYCTSLSEIWLPEWSGDTNWFQHNFTNSVAADGTLYIPIGKNIVSGANGCPATWTIQYYNPETGEVIE